jgi:signal peptidase I
MNEQENTYNTQRHASTAAMLSLVFPGLGQIYCGRLIRGLLFAFLGTLPLQAMMTVPLLRSQDCAPVFCAILLLLGTAVGAYAAVDAWLLARKTHADYALREYNSWLFYILWCLCGLGWSLGFAAMVRQNIMEAFIITSGTMEPQLVTGDRILVNKWIYQRSDPLAGDVVVFSNPDNRRETRVKRIIAVAGDTVAVKGGFAWVNGKKLAGDAAVDIASGPKPRQVVEKTGSTAFAVIIGGDPKNPPKDLPDTVVPKNHVFVLSDNRDQPADSRRFGPIPITGIKGRAAFVYWPGRGWSRIGTIE